MSVASKLQIKQGHGVAVLRQPPGVDLGIEEGSVTDDLTSADAAVVFVTQREDLASAEVDAVLDSARRDALAWVTYQKAGKLGTDLNRDSLAELLSERGLRAVRQISVDETWSALRFRPAE